MSSVWRFIKLNTCNMYSDNNNNTGVLIKRGALWMTLYPFQGYRPPPLMKKQTINCGPLFRYYYVTWVEGFRYEKDNYPKKVMVFAGLGGDGSTFGLKIFDVNETLTANGYYRLLRHRIIPELKRSNNGTLQGLTWQQDGASIHTSNQVTIVTVPNGFAVLL